MRHQPYILAYDLGTTGNKAALFGHELKRVASTFAPYPTFYPFANAAEQDPQDWWQSIRLTTRNLLAMSQVNPNDIACITFSGQMMGCVPVTDALDPLGRAIVWADQRATAEAARLEAEIGLERFYRIVGHRPSASYSAAKIMWMRTHEPDRYHKADKFLNAKDFVAATMTGNVYTDCSDASGTNLLNLTSLGWSEEVLAAAGLPEDRLPRVVASTEVVGHLVPQAAQELGLTPGTPVVMGGGDGSCAAAGAGVVSPGQIYHYMGSSSWLGIATRQPVFDEQMRTFNWVHVVPGMWSPTGTMQSAGASMQWIKDLLFPDDGPPGSRDNLYARMDAMAEAVPAGARGLLFLPYLLGERSPLWDPTAKGCFVGLTMRHGRAEMIRAVMEGVALNLKGILDAFNAYTDEAAIALIGGGANSALWGQILADVFEREIVVPLDVDEATSMGAAVVGGVGVGLFDSFETVSHAIIETRRIRPQPEFSQRYEALQDVFRNAYQALTDSFRALAAYA